MHEIEALRQLLFERGIITKDELIAKFKKLDWEMRERRAEINISFQNLCNKFVHFIKFFPYSLLSAMIGSIRAARRAGR